MTETVYLFDVDYTLLDNDRVADELRQHLTADFGAERQQRVGTRDRDDAICSSHEQSCGSAHVRGKLTTIEICHSDV
jgi:hypothetical protein